MTKERQERASPSGTGTGRDTMQDLVRRLDDVLRAMADQPSPRPATGAAEAGALDSARRLWAEERARDRVFGLSLLANPAWDLLLDLFIAREEGRTATLEGLVARTGAPHFALVRCIASAMEAGLLIRQEPVAEGGAAPLLLSEQALRLMCDYFNRAAGGLGAAAA